MTQSLKHYTLCLQHRTTQHLFYGRWRPQRPGVVPFAAAMQRIYQAIQEQDPSGVMVRDRIRELLDKSHTQILQWQEPYQTALKACPIALPELSTPYAQTVILTFTTPEAYQAAFLLKIVDQLLSVGGHCRQLGLKLPVGIQPAADRHRALQRMYRLLQLPFYWQTTQMRFSNAQTLSPSDQAAVQHLHTTLNQACLRCLEEEAVSI